MFHGVMVALEFLVLSVIVRIGVEQLPLPEPCLLHPRFGRALIPRSVYMTLLFFVLVRPILCLIFAFPDFITFQRHHKRVLKINELRQTNGQFWVAY